MPRTLTSAEPVQTTGDWSFGEAVSVLPVAGRVGERPEPILATTKIYPNSPLRTIQQNMTGVAAILASGGVRSPWLMGTARRPDGAPLAVTPESPLPATHS